jgi:YegS/Rv2252/BmrU family lipid kinase
VDTVPDGSAAKQAAEAAVRGTDLIVVIGGDGTVAEVAAGLMGGSRRIPLAIIPRGTANVLALNLGIPRDIDGAISIALNGTAVPIDAGSLNGQTYLVAAGTGSHAEMVAAANRRLKSKWGVLAYPLGWLRKSRGSLEPVSYTVTMDGETREIEATMIQVMNCGAVFWRGWEFAPGISPVDGFLDVVVYRATTLADYLTAAAYLLRGAPTETDLVEHWRGKRIQIDADPEARLQRDGEVAGTSPATIEIEPRAVPIVMPRNGPWAG